MYFCFKIQNISIMQNLKHLFLILTALFSCHMAMAQDYFLDRFYSDDGVD